MVKMLVIMAMLSATAWPVAIGFAESTPAKAIFFSSRRRHTRSDRDWSSDVCSSDLVCRLLLEKKNTHRSQRELLRFGRALGKILQVVGIHSHVAVVNKQLHQKSTCTGCADVPPHHP